MEEILPFIWSTSLVSPLMVELVGQKLVLVNLNLGLEGLTSRDGARSQTGCQTKPVAQRLGHHHGETAGRL